MSDKKEKDKDDYENEIGDYKRRLNILSKQVQVYEVKIKELSDENVILIAKLTSATKDSENIRTIMTNNITQNNLKVQGLLGEIDTLQKKNNS